MAADEIIDSLVDRSKVKGDIDFVNDLLEKVMSNIERINKSKMDIGGAKGMADTARAAESAASTAEDMAKSTQKVKQANEEIEKSLKGVNKQWLANAAELKENIALQVQYEAELKKLKTLLASAESAGNTDKIVEYRTKMVELKAAISELDRTTKYQAQSNNVLEDTFKRMSLELGNMRTLYKSLTTEEKNSPYGKELYKNITNLDVEVKKIDASLGNFQRNVGNYKSGFNGLNMSIQQMLRELPAFTFSIQTGLLGISNNIPMFFDEIKKTKEQVAQLRAEGQKVPGTFSQVVRNLISFQSALSIGVFLLTKYGGKVAEWAFGLFQAKEKMDAAAKTQDYFNGVLNDSNGSYAEAVRSVNELKVNIDLAKKGLIEKKDVLKEYNDGIGKTIGKVDSLREAEEKLMKHGDAYIKFTLLKAAATAASQEAAKKMLEAEKIRQKDAMSYVTTMDKMGQGLSKGWGNTLVPNVGNYQSNLADANVMLTAANRQENEAKVVEDEKQVLENIFKKLSTQAAELAKKHGFNFFQGGDGKNATEKLFKDSGQLRKVNYETQKEALEDVVSTNDAIVKNEEAAFLQRTEAAKRYHEAKLALNKLEYNYKIEDINAKETDDIQQAEKEYKIEAEKNKAIDNIRSVASAKRLQAQTEFNNQEKKINEQYYGEYLDQLEKFLDKENRRRAENDKEVRENKLKDAENKYNSELLEIDEQYAQGLLSTKQYQKEKKKLEDNYHKEQVAAEIKYQRDILQIQIEEAKEQLKAAEEIKNARGFEEDYTKLEAARKKIAELEIKLAKLVAKEKINANKQVADSGEKPIDEDAIKTAADFSKDAVSTFAAVSDIITAKYEREKNQLQEQIDLIEKKKAAEIDAINATSASEQEKAAQISIVEARAQAQREELERRQRAIEQKKARFQRAVNIATIIQETAIAVMKAFNEYGWAGALAAGALGAARLAAVIATPIPQYKHGIGVDDEKSHPGGLFIGGDGGKKELVVEPSGKSWLTDNKSTLYAAPRGTKVYPDANEALNAVKVRAMSKIPLASIRKEREREADTMIAGKLDRINSSIRGQKGLRLSITRYGTHLAQQQNYTFKDYLNSNLQS